ncbi:MAG TPA: DUF547 domain-containing protein [Abditibacteriaceae bacterium]|jgi:hypothetical protein
MKRTAVILSLAGLSTLAAFTAHPAAAQNTGAAATGAAATGAAVTSTASTVATKEYGQGIIFPHYLLDRALEPNVDKSGRVNYVALKGDKNLDEYLQAVATADLSKFPTLPGAPKPDDKDAKPTENRNPEMVFWINAYNAHILRTLANAYPISSPDEVKDLDTAKVHRVAGENWSLRDMRRKIASFDPRALFTLTNGTLGGPLLQPIAYRFTGIDQQLENAVQTFVDDPRNVELLRMNNRVTLNSYFNEFNEAFAPNTDPKRMVGVRFLLSSYSRRRGERAYFTTNDYSIDTKKSDRTLNIKSSDVAVTGS